MRLVNLLLAGTALYLASPLSGCGLTIQLTDRDGRFQPYRVVMFRSYGGFGEFKDFSANFNEHAIRKIQCGFYAILFVAVMQGAPMKTYQVV
jgi:hypothetical protein